jgi:hypothetical protein
MANGVGGTPSRRRQVFLYRLLSTGTLEEKIYMRQLSKGELSDSLVAGHGGGGGGGGSARGGSFAQAELRELFTLNETTTCDIFETLRDAKRGAGASKRRWPPYGGAAALADDPCLKGVAQARRAVVAPRASKRLGGPLRVVCAVERSFSRR